MKILNLYAGIGGNRKLWGNEHEITAVEYKPEIAEVYKDYFPGDTMIIADAHQYLLDHYKEFDFIWSSPPCQSHSKTNTFLNAQGVTRYPDMKLWQEILFLQHFAKSKYVIENVDPYYKIFIPAQKVGRHLFWANFTIPYLKTEPQIGKFGPVKYKMGKRGEYNLHERLGFDISKYSFGNRKDQILRNCVLPETGLHIIKAAQNIIEKSNSTQTELNFE